MADGDLEPALSRYAVVSSDTFSHYAFYAPLTCAVLAARCWTPLLLLVGTKESWLEGGRNRLIYNKCLEAGARVCFLGDFPGHRAATVAQVSRLFAHALVEDDDYLITSDIDMWPVGDWVGGGRDSQKAFQLYFSNAHDEGRVHFPMCYVGGTSSSWRAVLQGGEARDLAHALELCRTRPIVLPNVHLVGTEEIPLDIWNFDETYFGECLSTWSGFPTNCQMISRDFAKHGERRLDRSSWKDVTSLDGYADVHLLRPGYAPANWARVRQVFSLALPDKLAWADAYHADILRGGA